MCHLLCRAARGHTWLPLHQISSDFQFINELLAMLAPGHAVGPPTRRGPMVTAAGRCTMVMGCPKNRRWTHRTIAIRIPPMYTTWPERVRSIVRPVVRPVVSTVSSVPSPHCLGNLAMHLREFTDVGTRRPSAYSRRRVQTS